MALKLDFGKLPWHAQLGIFAVLGLSGVGAFWYFYASPAESKLVTKRAEVRKLQGAIKEGLATAKRLPEMLWLTDLKEEGDFITLEGRTTTLIGLSDFVNNLGTNAVLKKPIEILDSGADTDKDTKASTGPELIKFTVRAGLNGLPKQEEPEKGAKKKGKK